MRTGACVYILASTSNRLYIGVTTNLERRLRQHHTGTFPNSFTHRYNMDRLVHLEHFALATSAIAREKQLKRWSREKKLHLIRLSNPTLQDLSAEWGKPVPLQIAALPQPTVISTEAKRSGEIPSVKEPHLQPRQSTMA